MTFLFDLLGKQLGSVALDFLAKQLVTIPITILGKQLGSILPNVLGEQLVPMSIVPRDKLFVALKLLIYCCCLLTFNLICFRALLNESVVRLVSVRFLFHL